MSSLMWPKEVVYGTEIFELVQTDIQPLELLKNWWEGKYHWKNKFLFNVPNAVPFNADGILKNLGTIKSYCWEKYDSLLCAMYDLKQPEKKPLEKVCGNCAKFYRHYTACQNDYCASPQKQGHCFPTEQGNSITPLVDDKPHCKSKFVWREDLIKRLNEAAIAQGPHP